MRVGLLAQIDQGHRPCSHRAHALRWNVCIGTEAEVQSLSFEHDASQCLLEQPRIYRPPDLNPLANIVSSACRVDLLGKPDSELCGRKRQDRPLSCTWSAGLQTSSRTALEVRKQIA